MVVVAMVIGFPIALVLSWAVELTPEGIKREDKVDRRVTRKTGRKLTALVVLLVSLGGRSDGLFRFVRSQPALEKEKPTSLAAEIDSKSIAVLPFENLSEERANAYFADGISRTRF